MRRAFIVAPTNVYQCNKVIYDSYNLFSTVPSPVELPGTEPRTTDRRLSNRRPPMEPEAPPMKPAPPSPGSRTSFEARTPSTRLHAHPTIQPRSRPPAAPRPPLCRNAATRSRSRGRPHLLPRRECTPSALLLMNPSPPPAGPQDRRLHIHLLCHRLCRRRLAFATGTLRILA